MNCVSALSTARSTVAAFQQVSEKLDEGLAGETADLCMIFSSMHHADELARLAATLREQGKTRHVLGCTGESMVGEDREVERSPALAVWSITLPGATLRPLRLDEPGVSELDWANNLEQPEKAALLLLGDPFSFRVDRAGSLVVEGWVEGPCAMAADLRGMNALMLDFHDDPQFVDDLMEFCVRMETRFAAAQVAAGATLMGIGDAAASLIGPRLYERFVLGWEQRLVGQIHALGVPARLHICGNTRKIVRGMGQTKCEIVDLDFLTPLAEARAAMGPQQVLLGNIDPVRALRDGTPESVYAAIAECHAQAGAHYIVSAGCETPRGTPAENMRAMGRYAAEHS